MADTPVKSPNPDSSTLSRPLQSGTGLERFGPAYERTPPWEIGRPQEVIVNLARQGEIRGRVLDAGCGTGDNALYLASLGLDVTGVDVVPVAIERARKKALERGLKVRFDVADLLALPQPEQPFDTVIDSGVYHVFGDIPRPRYVQSLGSVLAPGGRYYMLVFSDLEPGTDGPRRVSQAEIHETFRTDWKVEEIQEARFETLLDPPIKRAWLARIVRLGRTAA